MNDPMLLAAKLVEKLSDVQSKRFRLRWKGSKIPRGATIGGVAIIWTQHGVIRGANSLDLGYYTRAMEFGGANKDEHEMIVSCDGECIAPEGSACEIIQDSLSS